MPRGGSGASGRCTRPSSDAAPFQAAQEQLGLGRDRTTDRRPPTKRHYPLRGRLTCASCGRRMEADTSGTRRWTGPTAVRGGGRGARYPGHRQLAGQPVPAGARRGDDPGTGRSRERAAIRDGRPGRAGTGPGAGRGREVGEVPGGARQWGRPCGDRGFGSPTSGLNGPMRSGTCSTPPRRSPWARTRSGRWWPGSQECADRFTRAMEAAAPEAARRSVRRMGCGPTGGSGGRCGGGVPGSPCRDGGLSCRRGDLNPHALAGTRPST